MINAVCSQISSKWLTRPESAFSSEDIISSHSTSLLSARGPLSMGLRYQKLLIMELYLHGRWERWLIRWKCGRGLATSEQVLSCCAFALESLAQNKNSKVVRFLICTGILTRLQLELRTIEQHSRPSRAIVRVMLWLRSSVTKRWLELRLLSQLLKHQKRKKIRLLSLYSVRLTTSPGAKKNTWAPTRLLKILWPGSNKTTAELKPMSVSWEITEPSMSSECRFNIYSLCKWY